MRARRPLGRHELGPKVTEVRQAVEDAGRDPAAFKLIHYGTRLKAEFVEQLFEMDFDEAVFAVDSREPSQVLEDLDQISEFVGNY